MRYGLDINTYNCALHLASPVPVHTPAKTKIKLTPGWVPSSWYHWRHLKISAGPGQRIPREILGYGGSLFQSSSGVKI